MLRITSLLVFCLLCLLNFRTALAQGINPVVIDSLYDELSSDRFGKYTPHAGFNLVKHKMGELTFKVYAQVRYLNQKGLDSSYQDFFGTQKNVDLRQDIQLHKVNLQFHGWLFNKKFRYLFYIWTNNSSQGQLANMVGAGNVSYSFNNYFTLGAGITGLPGVRSTEGNFPYWLSVDNRYLAEEFFRPSYTTGIFAKGNLSSTLSYTAMLGNNMSQLGVDAGQLDNKLNTFSGGVIWRPTTGEYGLNDNFGDLENHKKIATRFAAHFSSSSEDAQAQPNTDGFENVTLRISDGNNIFTPGLFGADVAIKNANYQMGAFDAGFKYKGFSLEGEYYIRKINRFRGNNTNKLPFSKLSDNGFHLQGSAMLKKDLFQVYAGGSRIYGEYGNCGDFRLGVNYYPMKNHVVRLNAELMNLDKSPVGGLALPYVIGGNGWLFYTNLEISF